MRYDQLLLLLRGKLPADLLPPVPPGYIWARVQVRGTPDAQAWGTHVSMHIKHSLEVPLCDTLLRLSLATAPKFAVLGFLIRCACMGCGRRLGHVSHALHCITLLDQLTPC